MLTKNVLGALALVLAVSPLFGNEARAQAGLLTGGATKLDPITLSSGKPLAKGPYQLDSGRYYRIDINATSNIARQRSIRRIKFSSWTRRRFFLSASNRKSIAAHSTILNRRLFSK